MCAVTVLNVDIQVIHDQTKNIFTYHFTKLNILYFRSQSVTDVSVSQSTDVSKSRGIYNKHFSLNVIQLFLNKYRCLHISHLMVFYLFRHSGGGERPDKLGGPGQAVCCGSCGRISAQGHGQWHHRRGNILLPLSGHQDQAREGRGGVLVLDRYDLFRRCSLTEKLRCILLSVHNF